MGRRDRLSSWRGSTVVASEVASIGDEVDDDDAGDAIVRSYSLPGRF